MRKRKEVVRQDKGLKNREEDYLMLGDAFGHCYNM